MTPRAPNEPDRTQMRQMLLSYRLLKRIFTSLDICFPLPEAPIEAAGDRQAVD
jgi:hypothetical protein